MALARRHAGAPEVRVAGATTARDVGDGRVSLVARSGRALLMAERIPAARAAEVVRTVLAGAAARGRR